jgi:hypothetical protein
VEVLLAVDPGPEVSGVVLLEFQGYRTQGKVGSPVRPAPKVLARWGEYRTRSLLDPAVGLTWCLQAHPARSWALAVEGVTSYGFAVGQETWETAYLTGRLVEAGLRAGARIAGRVWRRTVKLYLCDLPTARDAAIRRALLDRYSRAGRGGGRRPTIGTSKDPGPLYGVTRHAWAALAVGVTAADRGLDHVEGP